MKTNGKGQAVNIVVLDGHCANPGDLSWDGFKELGSLTVCERTEPKEVVECAKDTQIILVNKVSMKADIIAQLPQLKCIGVLTTGFNHIDVKAAQEHGVTVCNIPSYSTYSMAQMVFASIFAITNRIKHYARRTRERQWSKRSDFRYWDTPLLELTGKTMEIIGSGNIGMRVARVAREFGMKVYAYTSKSLADLPSGIQKITLDGLFSVSDVLSLHCSLSERTRELIKAGNLRKVKYGAILINTRRGPLVNGVDVAAALESGQLAAHGTNMMCSEPPAVDNPLLRQPNAFITPHIAWATVRVRGRLMNIALNSVRCFLEGAAQNVVNC